MKLGLFRSVIGTGMFSEISTEVEDFFGQRSSAFEKKLQAAKKAAFETLTMLAAEKGANAVELNPEVQSVGYGGLPNAEGVVELDAAIMDGFSMHAGAVACVANIKNPIALARSILDEGHHLFLSGEMLGPILLSLHNVAFYCRLMTGIRQAIRQKRFAEHRSVHLARWGARA